MLRFIKNFLFLFSGKPKSAKKAGLNETIDLILNRRSCRSFSDEEISEVDLQTILEAGRFAPSTVNLQTWSFITFTKRQWHELFNRPIPFNGTFAVVICADSYRLKDFFTDFQETPFVNLSFAIFNAGLAAMNMTIAAEALGIKSIMLSDTGRTGLLDLSHLKEKLHLPDGVLPLTTLVLGRPGIKMPGIPPRQPWNSIVMKNTYNHRPEENLRDWFDQMFIGFKLTHPLSNFDKQIECYKKKMLVAEKDIKREFLAGKKEH
jgi:FMN reductase (NADPH)